MPSKFRFGHAHCQLAFDSHEASTQKIVELFGASDLGSYCADVLCGLL